MARMTARIDDRAFRRQSERASERLPSVASQFLRKEQFDLGAASQLEVPVDTGALAGSMEQPPPRIIGSVIRAFVSYGNTAVQYALSVHENPRSGRTGGTTPSGRRRQRFAASGKWKYLEHPSQRQAAGFARRWATFSRAMLWRR